ncbi:MAG TPA: trehalase family glycosidase [Vicinamibacterales bacterium]|nr:trehalase family glycosidase [Vicinamibacterales bacterium]
MRIESRTRCRLPALVLAFALACGALTTQALQSLPPDAQLQKLREYIKTSWTTLTRSNRDLPRALPDPKMPRPPGKGWLLYLPPQESRGRVEAELSGVLGADAMKQIEVRALPRDVLSIREHGLLYLPHPYVVPGGRFNEMYGWDSYFIQVGLLRDGELARARDMADNFIYEIERYGTILNANRTYYLSRSQPPFLTQMILGVYDRTGDKAWLRSTVSAIDRYYRFWTTGDHAVAGTGLSRYFDRGSGPAPEVVADEKDDRGRSHYDRAREYYRTHDVTDYDESLYYDSRRDRLTDLFYKGDRSMRESGFDPSNRFGALNVDIIHYAPVCLNTLLYVMEVDAAAVMTALGDTAAARIWEQRASSRRDLVNKLMWDGQAGLYYDYNFQTKRLRHYDFATTFYPLWAGLASAEQASRVRANLARFEAPGGLLTSTEVTGNQWDAPFGWAPLQMIAVAGLRRYGFHDDADRLAAKFVSLVAKELDEHGTILEKYDVRRLESDVAADIKFGYNANQVGFGWTNGVVLDLLAGMRPDAK